MEHWLKEIARMVTARYWQQGIVFWFLRFIIACRLDLFDLIYCLAIWP
jgi:hypothetical protein